MWDGYLIFQIFFYLITAIIRDVVIQRSAAYFQLQESQQDTVAEAAAQQLEEEIAAKEDATEKTEVCIFVKRVSFLPFG